MDLCQRFFNTWKQPEENISHFSHQANLPKKYLAARFLSCLMQLDLGNQRCVSEKIAHINYEVVNLSENKSTPSPVCSATHAERHEHISEKSCHL